MKVVNISSVFFRCWIIGVALWGSSTTANALVIVVSGFETSQQLVEAYLTETFVGIKEVRIGDFSDFDAEATQNALAGADLVVIGRTLHSKDYSRGVSQGYNRLKIPVVVLTSYVSRSNDGRLGWQGAGPGLLVNGSLQTAGAETKLTKAGARVFGGSTGQLVDWHDSFDGTFNSVGLGDVGTGSVLAMLNEGILVAHWDVGDAPGNPGVAGVDVFPGERLLFNLDNDGDGERGDFINLTPAGLEALTKALSILRPSGQ